MIPESVNAGSDIFAANIHGESHEDFMWRIHRNAEARDLGVRSVEGTQMYHYSIALSEIATLLEDLAHDASIHEAGPIVDQIEALSATYLDRAKKRG